MYTTEILMRLDMTAGCLPELSHTLAPRFTGYLGKKAKYLASLQCFFFLGFSQVTDVFVLSPTGYNKAKKLYDGLTRAPIDYLLVVEDQTYFNYILGPTIKRA